MTTATAPPDNAASTSKEASLGGLTSDEARHRLATSGPNAMPDTSEHPLRMALEKFWAPVPWMLEAAIVLQVALGKFVEASARLRFTKWCSPSNERAGSTTARSRS